jgi:hypothetical protein
MINLRIFTYLSLYNSFTLSHIHNSLYFICRTLRAHNSNRFQKRVTIRRYSKKILCSFRRIIIAASCWRLFLKICKKIKSCRMIWINQIIQNESKQFELRQIHLSMSWKKIKSIDLIHRKTTHNSFIHQAQIEAACCVNELSKSTHHQEKIVDFDKSFEEQHEENNRRLNDVRQSFVRFQNVVQ